MKSPILAACAALVAVLLTSTTVFACGFSPVSIAQAMRDADRIVLGTVRERIGAGLATYTIHVERNIKGPTLFSDWVIRNAGASDCGMPSLFVGERVVLEYYRPGRITTGPWFYAWKIASDGTVAFSDSHEPPLPRTLSELLARYADATPPDTSTGSDPESTRGDELLSVFVLAVAAVAGAIASLRRRSRQGTEARGDIAP